MIMSLYPAAPGWTYPPLVEEGIAKQEGEVGMVGVGDRVELASAKVERGPRSGVVTAVRGRMITVRWDTGEQSTVVPASGTLSVLGHKAKSTGQTTKKATKKAAGKTASRAAKAVEGRSAKAAKAVERGGARTSKALKKSAGRAAKAVEASASKAEKAVDKAASKAAGRTRKSRKRAR